MNEQRFDPELLTRHLAKHGVNFVVVGGVAATLHGSPMLTGDVDIAYERTKENLRRLATALVEVHARLRGVEENLPFVPEVPTLEAGSNFTFETDLGNLDCLGWIDGIDSYKSLSRNAVTMRLGRSDVMVASIDDLILMKRAAARAKDRDAIRYLEAIKEVLER